MMKPVLEPLQGDDHHSFLVRTFQEKAFSAPYHFHPEYELTLILKGEGYRYIGNHMAAYSAGDLVLLGANLPHCWKSANVIKNKLNASAIVIQFSSDFMGHDFLDRPELFSIHQLLQRSSQGIRFTGGTASLITEKLTILAAEENTFTRLLQLLEILQLASLTQEFQTLDQHTGITESSAGDKDRMNAVTAYIVDHFRQDVFLDKAARIANMTPNAFCKYYKKITRKTFMETVIDYRINYAVQQLLHTDHSISAICYDAGFSDLSHLNRLFKRKMKMSPLQYRKKFNGIT